MVRGSSGRAISGWAVLGLGYTALYNHLILQLVHFPVNCLSLSWWLASCLLPSKWPSHRLPLSCPVGHLSLIRFWFFFVSVKVANNAVTLQSSIVNDARKLTG